MADGTVLLSPRPDGCAWVEGPGHDPRCVDPPAYRLTCFYTGMDADTCPTHTALMRAAHPDWIARVESIATGRYGVLTPTSEEDA